MEFAITWYGQITWYGEWGDPLEDSINKWEAVVRHHKLGSPYEASLGPVSCGLCREFHPRHNPDEYDCYKCPVRQRSKMDWCQGTPYEEYEDASGVEELLAAALREVEFLKSLRNGQNG